MAIADESRWKSSTLWTVGASIAGVLFAALVGGGVAWMSSVNATLREVQQDIAVLKEQKTQGHKDDARVEDDIREIKADVKAIGKDMAEVKAAVNRVMALAQANNVAGNGVLQQNHQRVAVLVGDRWELLREINDATLQRMRAVVSGADRTHRTAGFTD